MAASTHAVELIGTELINVINPRIRSKRSFRELLDSIEAVGLKRPITVVRRGRTGDAVYDLVCGQGRLEAFKTLGEKRIPAFIVDATDEDLMVKSLVENCARRHHSADDLLRDIGRMKSRRYSDSEIARKTGLSSE